MQYHITEQLHGQQWEQEQQSVIDNIRRRAQHDLEAQNPGSTVTMDSVQHIIHRQSPTTMADQNVESYLVEFVVEYTISGQSNTFAA